MFGRLANGDTAAALDLLDRGTAQIAASVGTVGAANEALYIPERAAQMLGGVQPKIDMSFQFKGKQVDTQIDSMSYGETTGDMTPFARIGRLDDNLSHIKSGLYAIYDFLSEQGLKGNDLWDAIIENAIAYLQSEIERVQAYLEENADTLDANDVTILKEYNNRLQVLSGKFDTYRVELTVQTTKGDAENVLDFQSAKLRRNNKATKKVESNTKSDTAQILDFNRPAA